MSSRLYAEERGQMAIFMVVVLLAVFLFFAMSLDAGAWYFDHRKAQNQAESAALAGVLELPNASGANALTQANAALDRNGSSSAERYTAAEGGTLTDTNGDGKLDTIRICVRRSSGVFFSSLAGITDVKVSACATAKAGPVNGSNVMPWAVVAPDPGCTEAAGRNCRYDANGDGDYTDPGDCNASWFVCPFGLTPDRLYTFKQGTGGNTGILRVCGSGANDYRNCLAGAASSGFFEVGSSVNVDLQGGTIANATDNGLQARAPAAAWDLPGGATCDVNSFPSQGAGSATYPQSPGYDPVGKAAATTKFVNPTSNPQCAYRLVPVPIISALPPNGGGNVTVLGVASFGVAKWNSTSSQDRYQGTSTLACRDPGNGQPPTGEFKCGVVWGYLFTGVTPPDALLEQIGDSNNPFAPILVALVD
ncbi:MAG: Tad domain-containing protein [Chloroflexi bacterium]|nr:Tad domain-containing protein [Chloroflexota bacterium]